ncbi:MAG: class I SAM-dependent methyltransferase [Synechococcales bacterium]|nr:class I SAM-dependent methyltransferase [Synechococcales bacterium]
MTFTEADIRPDELLKGQAERLAADISRLIQHRVDFVQVPCPACGAADCQPKFEKYGVPFVECDRCQTIYANPRPHPTHLADYYQHSENYAYWNQYIFPASEAVRREKIFQPRVQRVLDLCQRFEITTGTLLEVGAGFGTFCQEIQKTQAFQRVIGIEPTPDLAQTCRDRGLEILEQPIESVQLPLESLNAIVSFEVIEHLFCPQAFLQKCYQLLAPGGLLVLTCPNCKGFDILTLGVQSSAVDNEHLNLFHPASLTHLVTACGFQVVETQTPGQLDAELVRKQVLAGQFSLAGQPFLQQVLIDQWETVGSTFQQFLTENGLSSNLLIAARKP